MTRDELIRALEAAEGPDPQLDHEIYVACHREPEHVTLPGGRVSKNPLYQWPPESLLAMSFCPRYTASLDAKLPGEDDGWWEISGPRRYLNIPWRAVFMPWNDGGEHVGWGATEAIARRIAALRAQEASS